MGLQLNYIYSQIIFHLTYAQLKRIFEQQANYDLRRMLTGTEKFVDKLIELMDTNPCFFLGAVRCTLALGLVAGIYSPCARCHAARPALWRVPWLALGLTAC